MRKFARVAFPVLAVVALLVVGNPSSLWATPVPEIDPSSGMSALTMLVAAVLVIRGSRKK